MDKSIYWSIYTNKMNGWAEAYFNACFKDVN